ncbi:MAG TPA: sulfotransferase domain-containing protein [Allosphingosinicella sp.]|nr:sulfotransferase domain-containing protein [Allosphingosinicella sp.]
MSKNFVQNAVLRQALLSAYRGYARAQLWRSGTRILVNSIPKAGTHLLTAELEKLPHLQNSRLHIQAHLVNAASGGHRTEAFALDTKRVAKLIGTVRRGQFFSAHLMFTDELDALLRAKGVRTIFMLRDPRAILVSRFHYIMGLKRHHLHDFLSREARSDEERYRLLVEGHAGEPYMRPMADMMRGFLPWLDSPATLSVRFEDLVGERGGGSMEAKLTALRRICDHIGLAPAGLEQQAATAAKATPTLRTGQANAWREALPPAALEAVERQCGELIRAMGYPAE